MKIVVYSFFILLLSVTSVQARDAFQTVLPKPQPVVDDFEGRGRYGAGQEIIENVDLNEIGSLDIEIQGVFWDIDEPKVLINGQFYKNKDFIDEAQARILKIEKSKITVLYGNAMVEIKPRTNLD